MVAYATAALMIGVPAALAEALQSTGAGDEPVRHIAAFQTTGLVSLEAARPRSASAFKIRGVLVSFRPVRAAASPEVSPASPAARNAVSTFSWDAPKPASGSSGRVARPAALAGPVGCWAARSRSAKDSSAFPTSSASPAQASSREVTAL